jgi:hypothetical protein
MVQLGTPDQGARGVPVVPLGSIRVRDQSNRGGIEIIHIILEARIAGTHPNSVRFRPFKPSPS